MRKKSSIPGISPRFWSSAKTGVMSALGLVVLLGACQQNPEREDSGIAVAAKEDRQSMSLSP